MYLGFRLNVLPEGFDKLVMRDLSRRGSVVNYKQYADESQVAIFELGRPTPDTALQFDPRRRAVRPRCQAVASP